MKILLFKVYYIADDGTRTDMNATLVDGKIVFTTNHFSTYAVVFENEIVKDNGGLGSGFIVLMTMLSIIVAACIVLLVLYTLDQKGKLKRKDE